MKRLQSSLKGIISSFLFSSKDVRFITVAKLQPLFHGSLRANQSIVFVGKEQIQSLQSILNKH